MRFRKYYDAVQSNGAFFKAGWRRRWRILINIFRYLVTSLNKPEIIKNKPVVAQIEPTSECNLNCEMCIRDKVGVPIGTMSFENFKRILDKLDSLFKLHLSGQGEPFINPEIFEMIDYANNRGVSVFFTSNGTLLTPSVIEKICNVEIGEIGISIDSVKKEEYEKIRRGANFEKVVNNVRNLVKELKRNNKKTIVSIAAVLLKRNIDEIDDFVELACRVGVSKVGFQTIQEKNDYLDKYDKRVKEQAVFSFDKSLNQKILGAKKRAKKKGVTLIFDEEKSEGCIWPWRSIYITWDGYVTPCCKILDYRKPYFGNILKDDFWSVWNGPLYQGFRRLLRERRAPMGCVGCNRV